VLPMSPGGHSSRFSGAAEAPALLRVAGTEEFVPHNPHVSEPSAPDAEDGAHELRIELQISRPPAVT